MHDIKSIFGTMQTKKHPGWNTGIIVTRVWTGDLTEQEYFRIKSGSYGKHNVIADAYTSDGVPVFYQEETESQRIQALLDRECSEVFVTTNVPCNGGRSLALNFLGNVVDQGVRFFSVGTGTGTPAATDTAMFIDYFRKAPSSVTLVGNQMLIGTTFTTAEANTTYTEAGLIGGSTAVVTPGGAGTMYAHALYSYTKTSSVSLTNDYFLILS
jgi:hypothetical protein